MKFTTGCVQHFLEESVIFIKTISFSLQQNEIKRNIRKFSGFNFEKETPEYNKKEAILVR